MRKFVVANLALVILAGVLLPAGGARAEGVKQPVFLMCPHQKKYSAWSVYVTVDPANPEKILGLGLDKLDGVNSVDSGGFEGVQAAQSDAKTKRENLGTLSSDQFGKGQIKIEKDDALHLGIEQAGSDYRLMVSMRCTSDKRFIIGGKEQKNRDMLIKYDKESKTWKTSVQTMNNLSGKPLLEPGASLVGMLFPVTGTGIYRIVGALSNGESVVLIDGWRRED